MREYLTRCVMSIGRGANYERRDKIASKWTLSENRNFDHQRGTLVRYLLWNADRKARWKGNDDDWNLAVDRLIYEVIPSALLMYRVACTFDGTMPLSASDNLTVWRAPLIHNETSEPFTLAEYKGSATFWLKHSSVDETPQILLDDIKELLEYFVSDECAHPYDGLVAGGVA